MSYSGIGREEAEQSIASIRGQTGVQISYMPWIWGNEIRLEGEFSLSQLEALVELMTKAQS